MEKTEIYPATINQTDSNSFFHNILPPVLKLISQKETKQACIYKYSLTNAYVSPYGSVFKNGKVIKESIYKYSNKKKREIFFSFCKKILKNKVRKIDGDCMLIHHSWYQNYYHWMIEIMPRLFLMKDELSDKKLVIHKDLSKFHLDTLKKFNFKEIVFISDDEVIKCEKISFTSFPNYYINQPLLVDTESVNVIELNIHYPVTKGMKQWFKDNNPLLRQNTNLGNKKIYISRKKAGYRKILNEPALELLLNSEGFNKVFLEDFSFDEQVQLLHEANIVLGIHGAGLTNILFMQPGSHIINLISDQHHEFCYLSIASVANVNYSHINCQSHTKKTNPAYNDITVDVNKIKEILNLITPS